MDDRLHNLETKYRRLVGFNIFCGFFLLLIAAKGCGTATPANDTNALDDVYQDMRRKVIYAESFVLIDNEDNIRAELGLTSRDTDSGDLTAWTSGPGLRVYDRNKTMRGGMWVTADDQSSAFEIRDGKGEMFSRINAHEGAHRGWFWIDRLSVQTQLIDKTDDQKKF